MSSFSEPDLVASICRESFYEFVKEFWDTVITDKPVWNWHIKYLCDELQKVAMIRFADKPKEYDLVINISPGETKSTICSVMFAPWVWTWMDYAQIIGGSYSNALSLDLSRKGRDVVLSDKYQAAFPEIRLRKDQAVKSYYQNTKGGWRYATSTGGTVTGFHGHFLIIDDPLDPELAISEISLVTANDWMDNTLSQRKADQDKTPTILIMQRLHQNDCTANMIERAKMARQAAVDAGEVDASLRIKHICLPAEKTERIQPRKLRRKYKNNLMDPVRISEKVLREKRAKGDYFYSSQYLQWPVPRGGGMFKTERIQIDVCPKRWKRKVRFWDKAGTEGGRGAFTVGLLMVQTLDDRFGILDVIRGRWGSARREAIIKQTAQIDGIEVEIGVEQEPASGGKESAENTVKNLYGFRVTLDKPSGSDSSKELRADPFSVQVNNGNVFMVKAEWNTELIAEFTFFPYSTFKDQVDASSGAFNMLSGPNVFIGALR